MDITDNILKLINNFFYFSSKNKLYIWMITHLGPLLQYDGLVIQTKHITNQINMPLSHINIFNKLNENILKAFNKKSIKKYLKNKNKRRNKHLFDISEDILACRILQLLDFNDKAKVFQVNNHFRLVIHHINIIKMFHNFLTFQYIFCGAKNRKLIQDPRSNYQVTFTLFDHGDYKEDMCRYKYLFVFIFVDKSN